MEEMDTRPLAAAGDEFLFGRRLIGEINSPCDDFRVVTLQFSGKRLFEAFRVQGPGTLYSAATTDLEELLSVIRMACSGNCAE
jgi:hypothetical protein